MGATRPPRFRGNVRLHGWGTRQQTMPPPDPGLGGTVFEPRCTVAAPASELGPRLNHARRSRFHAETRSDARRPPSIDDVDKRAVLEDAKGRLLTAFGNAGVTRIEYVVGFVEPYEVSVWLGTETDAQRDPLAERENLRDEVAEALVASGIEGTDGVFAGVVVHRRRRSIAITRAAGSTRCADCCFAAPLRDKREPTAHMGVAGGAP